MVQIMEDENAAFWLPTHFLTDDDFFSADDNSKLPTVNNKNNNSSGFGFGSDPFDSPVSSPDNDENITENDDALLISYLTRHLAQTSIYDKNNNTNNTTSEKPWLFSTSPQSTLSGFGGGWSTNNRSGFSSNGSPNGPSRVPSPPLTPELKNDAAWDLLYEAAGQVARLKMNAIAAQLKNTNRGLLGAPRHAAASFTPSSNKPAHHHHHHHLYNQYQELKWAKEREDGTNYWPHHHHNNHQQAGSCGGVRGLSQTAWPPLRTRQLHNHNHNHNCGSQMRSMYQGGSGVGVKRQSAGTGVFLPRRVSTSPPRHHHHHHQFEPRNKPTVIPSRTVQELEATNLDYPHSRFGGVGFPTDFEMRMARRNAAVLGQRQQQQRRNTAMVGPGHEIRLPNDWTY